MDTFKPGHKVRVPYCRLQVKFATDRHPTEIVHTVELQGAKKPCNFFAITCPPKGNTPIISLCASALFLFEMPPTSEYARVTGGNRRQLEGSEECGKWYVMVKMDPQILLHK